MSSDPGTLGPPSAEAIDQTEAALAQAVRSGDPAAFEYIVATFGGRLLAVTRRILQDEEDARDAVQEAFVSAYRSGAAFEGGARVSTWLHRIAVNAALTKLRARRRRPEESIEDLLPTFREDGHYAQQWGSWEIPADEALAQARTRAAVRAALEQLPERYRTVILLRDIEGWTTGETARALGITPNAAKIRLHRARMALRTLIAPRFQGEIS